MGRADRSGRCWSEEASYGGVRVAAPPTRSARGPARPAAASLPRIPKRDDRAEAADTGWSSPQAVPPTERLTARDDRHPPRHSTPSRGILPPTRRMRVLGAADRPGGPDLARCCAAVAGTAGGVAGDRCGCTLDNVERHVTAVDGLIVARGFETYEKYRDACTEPALAGLRRTRIGCMCVPLALPRDELSRSAAHTARRFRTCRRSVAGWPPRPLPGGLGPALRALPPATSRTRASRPQDRARRRRWCLGRRPPPRRSRRSGLRGVGSPVVVPPQAVRGAGPCVDADTACLTMATGPPLQWIPVCDGPGSRVNGGDMTASTGRAAALLSWSAWP